LRCRRGILRRRRFRLSVNIDWRLILKHTHEVRASLTGKELNPRGSLPLHDHADHDAGRQRTAIGRCQHAGASHEARPGRKIFKRGAIGVVTREDGLEICAFDDHRNATVEVTEKQHARGLSSGPDNAAQKAPVIDNGLTFQDALSPIRR
jgi:hypothetical protein